MNTAIATSWFWCSWVMLRFWRDLWMGGDWGVVGQCLSNTAWALSSAGSDPPCELVFHHSKVVVVKAKGKPVPNPRDHRLAVQFTTPIDVSFGNCLIFLLFLWINFVTGNLLFYYHSTTIRYYLLSNTKLKLHLKVSRVHSCENKANNKATNKATNFQ